MASSIEGELNLRVLLNELAPVSSKYFEIGIQLYVPDWKIEEFEKSFPGNVARCFSLVLKHWLDGNTEIPVKWESLVGVLKSDLVAASKLAEDLSLKYVSTCKQGVQNEQPDQSLPDSGYESQCTQTPAFSQNIDSNSVDASTPPPPPPHLDYPHALVKVTDWQTSGGRDRVLNTLKTTFGHEGFLPGQEKAVMNILSGVSTLVIKRTASGKSLCYQLPAYLYAQSRPPYLTLVICPLISLMVDQLRHFPPALKGECLHSNQSQSDRDEVMRKVFDGKVHVLMLSAEALVHGTFWTGSGGSRSQGRLPPIAFACIDEVHCISEWSHNFRSSYLRLGKVLRERLGVHCVLGLTATATHTTALSVASNLGIEERNIIRGTILPGNLHISVSCDQKKDQALVELLQSSKFKNCESVIIYCTRQKETKRIATLLREKFQLNCNSDHETENEDDSDTENVSSETENEVMDVVLISNSKKRKKRSNLVSSKRPKMEWSIKTYHGSMIGSDRDEVQDAFIKNRVNIVVATVAFGMGLNKPDIRAIIHYNMPKSFESFVQEIGRAGRDGQPAFCHVFIDKKGSDIYELRHHVYNSTTKMYTLKKLVEKIFPVCSCSEIASFLQLPSSACNSMESPVSQDSQRKCVGHKKAILLEDMEQKMDIYQASISTLICYLEQEGMLKITSVVKDTCILRLPDGLPQLKRLAQRYPVLKDAVKLRKNGSSPNAIRFSVNEVAKSLERERLAVYSELNDLCNYEQVIDRSVDTRNAISVEFSGQLFNIESHGVTSDEEHDDICKFLAQKVKMQEEKEVEKLHLLHAVLYKASKNCHSDCEKSDADISMTETEQYPPLTEIIQRYFRCEGLDTAYLKELNIGVPVVQEKNMTPEQEEQVKMDVRGLLVSLLDSKKEFTDRTVARIFQGTSSPLFPAIEWGRSFFWRKYMNIDFNELCRLASEMMS